MLGQSILTLSLHILHNAADHDTVPSLWLQKGAAQFSSCPAKLADVGCASTCISVVMAMRTSARLPSIASAARAANKLNHPSATETALRSSYRSFAHRRRPCARGGSLSSTAQHGNVLSCQKVSKRSDAENAQGAHWPASTDVRPLSLIGSSTVYAEPGPSSHGLSLDGLGASRAGGPRALALGHGG